MLTPEEKKNRQRATQKRYRDRNKEKRNAYSREWRKKNPQKQKAACDKWRKDNPDKVQEYSSQYYKDNKDTQDAKRSKWARDNPLKRKLQSIRERAKARIREAEASGRKRALKYGGEIGDKAEMVAFYTKVLNANHMVCDYCGRECGHMVVGRGTEPTVDHRVALSKGGSHTLDNLAACCRQCNSAKNTSSEEEFRELLSWMLENNVWF